MPNLFLIDNDKLNKIIEAEKNIDLSDVLDANMHFTEQQTARIESEMQERSGSYPMPTLSSDASELLEPVLTKAFITQPILGDIIIAKKQRDLIHMMAMGALSDALNRVSLYNYGLSDFKCDILVLETVLILRNWNDGNDDNNADNPYFWEYICNQYAMPFVENFGSSYLYEIFRYAIEKSLTRHKRLFLKTGKRYYTSMLTHAFAPKSKFNSMFEQIFSFYAKTLHYHYIKADPAFRAFVYAMKKRFESVRTHTDDNVYIKSVQSSSAIRALFLQFPEYMQRMVERIVYDIDALVATGHIYEYSYLDTMLVDWYKKRSSEEHFNAKRERTLNSTERIITEFSNIRPSYYIYNGKISLTIPAIRLGVESENQPTICIYRYPGDAAPYMEDLCYYGDDFCITSSKTPISLDELLLDDAQRIELRAVISFAGKDIFDSGAKLYRDAIAFCVDGSEILKRPDNDFTNIFVPAGAVVAGDDTSPDCTAMSCGKGYLYRVFVDENTYIAVNGINLFPVEQMVNELVLNISAAPVSHCKLLLDQLEYSIFSKQINLTISSENKIFHKQYRLMIDSDIFPLTLYYSVSLSNCILDLPYNTGFHVLRIIDNTTQQNVYTLNYIIINDFSLNFDGIYYYDGYSNNGYVEVSDFNAYRKKYPYKILPEQEMMLIPYNDGFLSIDTPTLCCHLNGETLLAGAEQIFWYKDIPMSALLEVDTPRGYSCAIIIGQRIIDSDKIEIGNELRAKHDSSVEAVGIIIRKKDEFPHQIKLFDIYYEPSIISTPLLFENDSLFWAIEKNYVGDTDSEFKICVYKHDNEIMCFNVGYKDVILNFSNTLNDGHYKYKVYNRITGFYTRFLELFSERFLIGDPSLSKFEDSAVIITEAIIETKHIKLKQASGIITNLRYKGEQPLNGETLLYPCYEGCMLFKNNNTLLPYATKEFVLNGIHREQVNPVKLWVINDYIISLRDPEDDGLYVNKNWASITDRKPQKNTKEFYCNPDYYSYKIIRQSEVINV